MSEPVQGHTIASASIKLDGDEVKIEKLLVKETKQEILRLSAWSQGELMESPLTFTEKELITLLQAGMREGILTPNFLTELRKVIEI
jgi:hypothetical protein